MSSQQLQNGSRVSWKLCLNLCAWRRLKDILSLLENFNPSKQMWTANTELGNDRISLRTAFLKPKNEVELRMLILSSFHPYIQKKKVLKSNRPSFQQRVHETEHVGILLMGWDRIEISGFVAHLEKLAIKAWFLDFREKSEKKVLFLGKIREKSGKAVLPVKKVRMEIIALVLRVHISKSCFITAWLLSVLSLYLCLQFVLSLKLAYSNVH